MLHVLVFVYFDSSSSSSDFLLKCKYRGNSHISGPPSRYLACGMHGRSHKRCPGMSIMRVYIQELPLSAVTLCQLLPCYLGPPRPMLSINLYVTGYLDCTIGAFHMSIPVEPSLLQNEIQIPNAKPRKYLIGSDGDSVLRCDIADLSDHCPVILLQMLEVWLCQWPSLTGMEHCALHTRAVHATCLEREVAGRAN